MIDLNELLGERSAKVYSLRNSGETFQSIGEKIGVSKNRARVIFFSAKRKIEHSSDQKTIELKGLSGRTKNCLGRNGYYTKEQIKKDILKEILAPSKKKGYGGKMHSEVLAWIEDGVQRQNKPAGLQTGIKN